MAEADERALRRFDELWDFDDPAGTEARFREILLRVRDRSLSLQIRTQLARSLGLQKKWEEARAVLDGVEAALPSAPDVVRVRWLLERGRVANSSGDPESARPLLRQAWELSRAAGEDALAVDAAHMVAIVEKDGAIEWNERALELARKSPDPRARKWRGSLLNNLGWACHARGEHEEALALFEEALAARREQGDRGAIRIARWCVGRANRSLGRTEEALAEQEALRQEFETDGGRDGYVFEEIAECLLALGRADEARPFFAAAAEELSGDPWLSEREPQRLVRLEELARGESLSGKRPRG